MVNGLGQGRTAPAIYAPAGRGRRWFFSMGARVSAESRLLVFCPCDSQEEIDSYWDKLMEDGKPMACG